MSAFKIKIDDDFKGAIPPLSYEERQHLEENIKQNGCREPLAIWNGYILDGHNRFEICTRLNIPYSIASIYLPDKEAALDWIDRNQLGRRNLHPNMLSIIRGRIYARAKKAVKNPDGLNQHSEVSAQSDQKPTSEPTDTAEKIASQTGVSRATVVRDAKIAKAIEVVRPVDPEMVEKFNKGKVTKKALVAKADEISGKPATKTRAAKSKTVTMEEALEMVRKGVNKKKIGSEKESIQKVAATTDYSESQLWEAYSAQIEAKKEAFSNAMDFVEIAIVQLEKIRKSDPMRSDALHRVIRWATEQLKS